MELGRRIRILTKLTWRKLKRSRRVVEVRENGWNAVKAIALLVSFILLAWWLERTTSDAITWITSIPLYYLWWGLGIVSGITLVAWLLKKVIKREAPTASVYKRSWFRRPAVVVPMILIGVYGPITYFAVKYEMGKQGAVSHLSRSLLPLLPAEIALPIIAQCESKGRQFNSDGSIVTNNNTDGTIDRGKWQINSRHDERVKRLGIDILTEEGNEKFARILYAENYLRDWEASRHCWESQLMAKATALGLTASTTTVPPTTDTTFIVVATPVKPVEVVMPPDWHIVWWGDKAKFKSHAVERGANKVRVFTARTGVGSAEIKVHRYYDPDPNWWRRQ